MISKLTKNIGTFLREEDGPTAVEYAIMLGLIIVACIASVLTFGSSTNGLLNDSLTKMQAVFAN